MAPIIYIDPLGLEAEEFCSIALATVDWVKWALVPSICARSYLFVRFFLSIKHFSEFFIKRSNFFF